MAAGAGILLFLAVGREITLGSENSTGNFFTLGGRWRVENYSDKTPGPANRQVLTKLTQQDPRWTQAGLSQHHLGVDGG